MRRSVGLLFIIGLLGSRCRTDNRLWIATLGTLDWSLAATNFAAICPRIARQSHWLPACDVSLQSTHHSTSRRPRSLKQSALR